MWTFLLFAALVLVLVGLLAAVFITRNRFDHHRRSIVDTLRAAAAAPPTPVYRTKNGADLPPPVRRYLHHVLQDEQPCIRTARLRQTGTFRSGDAASPWSDFTATQHVTTSPPGFVWEASIAMLPGLSVQVLDAYTNGHGLLQARLGGVVPVADPTPGPALDEGELLRYLAESPLYPTALLPGMGVTWTAVDDHSARATLTDNDTTVSLLFHVNDRNDVERVTGKRPFLTDEGTYETRPWRGTWRAYERRSGMRVPTEGEVAWIHPDGEASYWRAHVDPIEYELAEPAAATPDNS